MKKPFLSKKFHENFGGEKWFQRSNVPTDTKSNNYNINNQLFIFLLFCWNLVFLLEPVGTCWNGFLHSVGTIFCSNSVLERSNETISIKYQSVKSNKMSLLERWNVGTKNNATQKPNFFL